MENLETKGKIKTPPVKQGYVRLYRGETYSPTDAPFPDWLKEQPEIVNRPSGVFFTNSLDEAKVYNKEFGIGDGNIIYVDILQNELEIYRASNNRGKEFSAEGMAEKEFFLPPEISKKSEKFQE